MRHAVIVLVVVRIVAIPALARAQATVDVRLTEVGERFAAELGLTAADLAAQIESQVEDAYRTYEVDRALEAFADATSFSARGIGVDYASAPRGWIVGVAANVATGNDDNVLAEELSGIGLAANLGLMLGGNLSVWGHPRWTLFANGFYSDGSTQHLDGAITSAGAHVQYAVIEPSVNDASATGLRWLGLAITGGAEYTRWKVGHDGDELTTAFDVGELAAGAGVSIESDGRIDLRAHTLTAPFELTTAMRVALILTLYVGAGVDLTMGRSRVDAFLEGTASTRDGRELGEVTLTAEGDRSGSPVMARVLAGAQINLSKLKLFAQVNASQVSAASISVGLKFVP